MTKIILAFCCALVFGTSAFAKDGTITSDLKSYCNSEGPEMDAQRTQLEPWFRQLNLNIQKQSEYQKIVQDLQLQLNDKSIVLCWIKLKKSGAIEKLSLNNTTGSEVVDQSVENLVRNLDPFDQPIGSPYPENIQVRIHKKNGHVEISTELNTRATIKPRIGESVH